MSPHTHAIKQPHITLPNLTVPFRRQPVLCFAVIAMLITCIFVPVDREYLSYFNVRTLCTLFCTLAVVAAFAHIHTFELLAKAIVVRLHNLRNCTLALVFITFFGSMLLANDMALLTFLPLGYYVLHSTGNDRFMAFTFIMQNIAANLGGLLTPFGNPQNLYLYSYYSMENAAFFRIMAPTFVTALLLIFLICLFVRPIPLALVKEEAYSFNVRRLVFYSILFIASIAIVFRVFPYLLGTALITLCLLFADRKALREVNYPLLLTFAAFFVFSGNLARIPTISSFFSAVLPHNTLLFGILSCQFISNVPSAVLLSHFTNDYASLLPAVNIGGLGTIIASLASLITFTEYRTHNPGKTKQYLLRFTALNFGFLLMLFLVESLVLAC